MSSRTYMLSIKSLEPIKKAVGSRDEDLLNHLKQALEEDEDFQSYAEDMIMISPPPENEPGCWNYLVEPLAQHFGLSPKYLPIDDWKHYYVWEDYRAIVDSLVSAEAKLLLEFLEAGRPFVGTAIDHDGCMFGWLRAAEVQILLKELTPIDVEMLGDLDEFHEELVASLQETVNNNADLFVGAH